MAELLHLLTDWLPRPAGDRDDGERGASVVEYGLLIALIAVLCIAAVTFLGEDSSRTFSTTASRFAAN